MKTSNVSEIYWFKKNARLEITRVRGRGSESATARKKSRSLALALSRSRASRFLKGLNFRHVWNLAFLFLNEKTRLEIARGPNGTP